MARKKKDEAWYAGYLRRYINQLWGWHPERRKALKRALWPTGTASQGPWRCEECGAGPLERSERDVDHVVPRESLTGFDGWGPYIERALDVQADALVVKCKPCHQKKSAEENAARRAAKRGK